MAELNGYIIFAFIPLAIFIVLLAHELGHFFVAKAFKFSVDEFVIGAGPEFWSRTDRNGTLWRLCRYPVKAHVHVQGFEDETRSLWKRALIVLAGPVINLIFPFFVFLAFFVFVGQPATAPVLSGVEIGAAADQAGLEPGDRIIAVNGISTYRYKDVKELGYDHTNESIYKVQRGAETFETTVRPSFLEFIDTEGVERSYPRLGTIWRKKAFQFQAVHSVGGVEVEGDDDKTRAALVQHFDQEVILGLNSTDGSVRSYKVRLSAAANSNIQTEEHEEYERIFVGAGRDDFYFRCALLENIVDAAKFHTDMLGKVLKIPFQLFPIDKESVTPEAFVVGAETWFANGFYHWIYKMALISFIVAYVNFLPLPYLDGSYLLFYAIEAAQKKPPTRRQKYWGMALCFFALYMAMLISNLDNVPRYIDSRLEKLQKFTNTKI